MNEQEIIIHDITPSDALRTLQEGNFRFVNNLKLHHDLLEQVNQTRDGQQPFAAILSCMDSRTSAELVFDQGLGDIFSIRVAGNVVSGDILGSLEYAAAVTGIKLVVVLGHTNCGAIRGACDQVEIGHLTGLLQKIKPAMTAEKNIIHDRTGNNQQFVNAVAAVNAKQMAGQIVHQSEIIRKLVGEGKTGIVPAMYDVATGLVVFFEEEAILKQVNINTNAEVA